MNRLPIQKRIAILQCFVEGCSMRATSRMVDVSINTVTKFLIDLGTACSDYQDEHLRGLTCKRVQLDEIWSFTYAKQKNVQAAKKPQPWSGDTWTWVAIDADTKLIPSWLVGGRNAEYAKLFINDLAGRLSNHVQLTSDGHKPYLQAVEDAFGANVDYAMLVKLYGGRRQSS